MINIIIIIIIWSLNIPIIRQELTVQSRALQCCTALFITALWNYITTPPLLQTIADAVHLTISPCEVERTPGHVNSSQRAAGLTSLFLKSHCHLIDVSTATPRYQSPHYFSTDLVHPWHLPTVETYAVTSAKEMSKQGLSYEYLREGVSSTFWQHFKLVISHSCREHREPPAFQETVCLNL